jgi:hypothetical protein
MSDISSQLIKDSYNYVLQSDLSTGIVYRIGGGIPVNPKFLSGLTINSNFNYSNGTEQPGFVLITDAFGNASWGPISGSSSGDYLSLSGGTITGDLIINSGLTATTISATTYQNLPATPFLPLSGGTVTGTTSFTGGLTANTISATTYQNLPQDIFVTGGTYTSGNAIFTNNSGGTFTVSGFAVGGGGGQTFYLNLSQSQNGNRLLSTTASTSSEQSTGVTISNGVTSTISSFQSQPLNTTLLPGGVWGFYLHSYKQNSNASFDIFVELYKRTSGGTQTLLFTTDPAPVTTNSPNPSMQLSDGYFSGTPLSVSDSIVAVVRATNTGNQPHSITLVTEGTSHYSYVVSTIPTQQGLTCDTLSGCSIIQTIQTDVSNKLDKSGGTITGNLIINSGLTANTISATTYQNLPTDIRVTGGTYSNGTATFTNNTGGTFNVTGLYTGGTDVFVTGATYSNNTFTYTNNTGGTFSVLFNTLTGLTVNGNLTVTGTTTSTTISATTYQNLPATPFLPLSGGTVTGATSFTGGLTANTISATTYQNLPTDIRVTGGTYSGSTIIFTNNTGGTFSVTGITTSSAFTGGTVSGATIFTGGLTANTISATTYYNLPPSSVKSINSVSINTNAENNSNTDYIYFASNTITITLPTAISNTNSYVIKNVGTGRITINTTSSQTIDGSLTALINVQYLSLTLISDGANWNII